MGKTKQGLIVVGQYSNGNVYVGTVKYHNSMMKEAKITGESIARYVTIRVVDVDDFIDRVEDGEITINDLFDLLDGCNHTTYTSGYVVVDNINDTMSIENVYSTYT